MLPKNDEELEQLLRKLGRNTQQIEAIRDFGKLSKALNASPEELNKTLNTLKNKYTGESMKENKWIEDKERCWICKRTRKEVLQDSHPHGDLFDEGTGEEITEKDVFVKEGIEIMGEIFPICKICHYIVSDIAEASTEQYLKDRLG